MEARQREARARNASEPESAQNRRVGERQRDSDGLVALLQLVLGPDTSAIDAHLAATQQPIDTSLGDAGQFVAQKIVNPLACALIADDDLADPAHLRGRAGT